MDQDTLLKIIELGTGHKWLLLAIFVISWITSLTNDWSRFPITVSKRLQPVIVAGLGIAYGVLTMVQGGETWLGALQATLIASGGAYGLFAIVIKAIYNGDVPKWLGILSLAKKDDDEPPSPPTPPRGAVVTLLVCVTLLEGCTPQARALLIDAITRKIECGISHQDRPDKEILALCAVQPEDAQAVLDAVGQSRAIGADHAYAAASIAKKDAADKCAAAGAFKK
jgi:hypothetical protein